jgi:hypothetical protein
MTGSEVLADFRDDLAARIGRREKSPALQPLPISLWVGMTLLQKSARRGRVDLAYEQFNPGFGS